MINVITRVRNISDIICLREGINEIDFYVMV